MAKENGLSLNKTIKLLLKKALRLNIDVKELRAEEFGKFLGVWNENDYQSFENNTRDFGQIDKHLITIAGLRIWSI